MTPPATPKCCYCGSEALGRCEFTNTQDSVVDNPFCQYHMDEVLRQTMQSIRTMHNDITYDIMATRFWGSHVLPPDLFKDEDEIMNYQLEKLGV